MHELDKLNKLQFRAARVCLGFQTRTPREVLSQNSQLPNLSFRRQVHLRNYMFKRKGNTTYTDERLRETRGSGAVLMKTKRARFASYEQSVDYRGSREWNSLCVKAPSHQTSSHYVLENVAKTGSNGVRTE